MYYIHPNMENTSTYGIEKTVKPRHWPVEEKNLHLKLLLKQYISYINYLRENEFIILYLEVGHSP